MTRSKLLRAAVSVALIAVATVVGVLALTARRNQIEQIRETLASPAAATPDASSDRRIDLNAASVDELETLPGIGEKTAREIVAYRQTRPFEVIEDIMNVPNIGEAKFQRIRDLIAVGSPAENDAPA